MHNSHQMFHVWQGDEIIYHNLTGTRTLIGFVQISVRYKGPFQLWSPLSPSHSRIMRLSLFCVMLGFPCWVVSTLMRPLCPGNHMTWFLWQAGQGALTLTWPLDMLLESQGTPTPSSFLQREEFYTADALCELGNKYLVEPWHKMCSFLKW